MSESILPPIQTHDEEDAPSSSPRVMVTTMVLLIAGLLLSTALLLDYVKEKTPGLEETAESDSERTPFLDQIQSWASAKKADRKIRAESASEEISASKPSTSPSKNLFSSETQSRVRWPKLKLTGFGKGADQEGDFAIINGQQVLVNTYIGDVKLIEIRTHGALVEYQGETKTLTVDQAQ